MERPTPLEGVAFALAASLGGSILFTALAGLLPGEALLRMLLAGFGFAYLIYLMARSRERVGRVVVVAVWFAVAAIAWWLPLPLPFYVLVHVGLIWLVRSLYHHASVLPALADLGLLGLGLATALWALSHTQSLFFGVWCFFLVQSLFVLIPPSSSLKAGSRRDRAEDEERFERAHRNAKTALRKLHSFH